MKGYAKQIGCANLIQRLFYMDVISTLQTDASVCRAFYIKGDLSGFSLIQKRSAMDAHSREMRMLHKCNRARRQNVASDILFN